MCAEEPSSLVDLSGSGYFLPPTEGSSVPELNLTAIWGTGSPYAVPGYNFSQLEVPDATEEVANRARI